MTRFQGTFQSVIPVAPYGYYRSLMLLVNGNEESIRVGFKKIQEQTKGIKKGDAIEVEYHDYDDFTIRKI